MPEPSSRVVLGTRPRAPSAAERFHPRLVAGAREAVTCSARTATASSTPGAAPARRCGKAIAGRHAVVRARRARRRAHSALPLADARAGAGNDVTLSDPSVSRSTRACASPTACPLLEDAGSSHGTFLDGRRLDGARRAARRLRRAARRRAAAASSRADDADAAGPHARRARGLELRRAPGAGRRRCGRARDLAATARALRLGAQAPGRPRRAPSATCCAICAAAASCGSRRAEAELFRLLDGRRTVPALVALAEERFGSAGPAALARLLADLAERGLLHGSRGARAEPTAPDRASCAACCARACGSRRIVRRPCRAHLRPRRLDALPQARAGRCWSPRAWPASPPSATSWPRATARRSSSSSHVGIGARSSSSPGASRSWRCTSCRTAWPARPTAGASRARASRWC